MSRKNSFKQKNIPRTAEDMFSLVEIHTPKAKKLIVLALTSSL
jgi:hypothetical protein